MGAIVVAMIVGLIAVGLVVGLVIFSAVALVGVKAVNAAHEGRSKFVNRRRRS
ncbi:hypothetical protein [Saccharopolyspora hordei]|uniref:Uncharacterized protein n=1 Tax=Saccharopolyspora hordei TaxID=1838 RepID=A0A853AJZ4_9PSEU|nr:hypothetical protein [Saccharopolyspora hordei]NYI82573.1 hypothetical protein [Saccharopolyspora hordei]